VIGVAPAPGKANAPLIVDSNTELSLAVSAQPSRRLPGKCRQDSQIVGRIEHIELPKRRALDGANLRLAATKEALSLIGPEGLDHCPVYNVLRLMSTSTESQNQS